MVKTPAALIRRVALLLQRFTTTTSHTWNGFTNADLIPSLAAALSRVERLLTTLFLCRK